LSTVKFFYRSRSTLPVANSLQIVVCSPNVTVDRSECLKGRSVYVTQHSNITDPIVLTELWGLYVAAYERIAAADISRETLFRSEFDEVMADPTNKTYVVRDGGLPVSMATISTDIGSTRYLSRAYFESRDPDRLADGRVHYLMWAVTHPDHQGGRATFSLARGALVSESALGALLVFDLPESNQPNQEGGGAELFYRLAQMVGPVSLQAHGGSRYYALDFAPVDAGAATDTSDGVPVDAEHASA
jgi:hypothetical protein